jgi:hypothetical protein
MRLVRLRAYPPLVSPAKPGRFTAQIDSVVQHLAARIRESARFTPKTPWAAAVFLFTVLQAVAAVLTILTYFSPADTPSNLEDLAGAIESLAEEMPVYCNDAPRGDVFLVGRQAAIHDRPNSDTAEIERLGPNELVWVAERSGDWVRVIYVGADGERCGWTKTEHLTR